VVEVEGDLDLAGLEQGVKEVEHDEVVRRSLFDEALGRPVAEVLDDAVMGVDPCGLVRCLRHGDAPFESLRFG
jgi:hypothetical protein